EARLGALEYSHREAVDQAQDLAGDATRDATHRVAQSREVRLVQSAGVYTSHAARDDHDAGGATKNERVELLASLRGVLLGVVQRAERPQLARGDGLVVEQHTGRHQRPGEAPAPRLVGSGDEAHAETAIEREQPPPAARASRAAPGASGGAGPPRRLTGRLGGRGGRGRRADGARGSRSDRGASRSRWRLR